MRIINKWFDMDFTLVELTKESRLYFNDTEMNSEKILKCLRIALNQEKKISSENLSVYRLESLIMAITIKKIMIKCFDYNINTKNTICDTENQLKSYMGEAIALIKEIIITGRIKNAAA
jgi:hypothetical protein